MRVCLCIHVYKHNMHTTIDAQVRNVSKKLLHYSA